MDINPKRRKKKDNPYSLIKDEANNLYIVSFTDSFGIKQEVKVKREIWELFNANELRDLSELNEYDNHIEHSNIFDNKLNERLLNKPIELEDEEIKKSTFEEVRKAIDLLNPIQKRRIIKYYFENKNEYEIAGEENTNQSSVHRSLTRGIEKLKIILKNL